MRKKKETKNETTTYTSYTSPTYATWETGVQVIDKCPYMNKKYRIIIDSVVYYLCKLLDREFVGYEFLLMCNYDTFEDDILLVKDPYVPQQFVTSASVHLKEHASNLPVLIHKHPSGLYNFSSVDEKYANSNVDISILYVDGWFRECKVKIKLPCGYYTSIDSEFLGLLFRENAKEEAEKLFEVYKNKIERVVYDYSRVGFLGVI